MLDAKKGRNVDGWIAVANAAVNLLVPEETGKIVVPQGTRLRSAAGKEGDE